MTLQKNIKSVEQELLECLLKNGGTQMKKSALNPLVQRLLELLDKIKKSEEVEDE